MRPDIDQAVEVLRNGAPAEIALELERAVGELIQASDVALSALRVNVAKAFGVPGRDQVSLRTFAAKASQWRDSMERFDQWRRLSAADEALRSKSAAALAEALATDVVKPEKAKAILACTHAETVWKKAVEQTPALQHFQGLQHNQLAEEFRSLEAKRRTTTIEIVRSRHSTKMPRGSYGAMHTIRSEVKRKRGHMPIRKLFKAAGETLQRIKPVLLMSPISVAQFLAPGSAQFDLLVIDEASQVRPEDALGLVVRAKQIVVVGDNKQLPPTSFFERVIADEEDDEVNDDAPETALSGAAKATELESILALCEARGLNSAMLRWHYRSRHPSLIEVSNAEFYRRLVMPPAPSSQRSREGLILTRVAGAYDRGGKRINAIEAEAVAKAVARHATVTPELSLGVATFSSVQRDAISDLLDIMRRTDDSLDAFLSEGKTEDIFVKNLENVQGDERDVIFVSVGYGPRTVGSRLDSMAFGPVSMEGGERRLNVLFTRARSRCEIFCSFAAGDIDLDRTRGEGPRVLKRFLQYAESGVLEEQVSTSDDFDSPFEEAVAAVIDGLGYKVDKQVGSAGFKIDLAIRDPDEPGRYMLAVECDGATYHRALWARERDRLRQDVLENMGWKFHRIWSTDWFYRRGNTLERLNAALEAAKHSGGRPPRAKSSAPFDPLDVPSRDVAGTLPTTPSERIPAYELANCRVPFGVEPHLAPGGEMTRITRAIVETEGPVHEDEIARRVATLFGKARTGSLINAAAIGSLRPLKQSGLLVEHDGFWMTPAQAANPPVRDRSSAPLALQRADMLSPLEIRAAAKIAMYENGTLSNEEMATAITRLLGFKRTGSELKFAIENALEMR
jgi:very-short-patch-repair endonuclease